MKFLMYGGLVLLLVPVQTTLLPHIAIWGIKPDLGLVVAAVVGLLAGELEGLLVGLAIGWVLNLYSAGDLWLSLVTNRRCGIVCRPRRPASGASHPDDPLYRALVVVVGWRRSRGVEYEECDDVRYLVDDAVGRGTASLF